MSYKGRFRLGRTAACAAIGGLGLVAANSGIALASYGPTPPTPTPIPGGFQCVVTSQGIGPGGKTIGPIPLHGLTARIKIQPHSFAIPAAFQLTITQPEGSNGSCQTSSASGGQAGSPAVEGTGTRLRAGTRIGGIGILVQLGGVTYKATFRKPLLLSLSSPSITRSSRVEVWNGQRFILAPHSAVRAGVARVSVYRNNDYEVLGSAGHRAATTAVLQPAARAGSGRAFLTAARLLPAGSAVPGLGVITGS